ncbi:MAG: HEAT repeat domain-containing protein, partial [Candidatus Acidiferrales bacterium]
MIKDAKTTAARAFVRSFNVLLKFARLYGMEHARCVAQLEIVSKELQAALPARSDAGLLLSASGSQLLLDGVPLEATPAERSFAQMLSGAEISSLHFLPKVTRDDLVRLVTSFPTGAGKKALGEALKKTFEGDAGIRINTISYIPADSATVNLAAAASITARALGVEGDHVQSLIDDPGKLIQLITAAEGVRSGADAGSAVEHGGTGEVAAVFPGESGGVGDGTARGGPLGASGAGAGARAPLPARGRGSPAKSLTLVELIQAALGSDVGPGAGADGTQAGAPGSGAGGFGAGGTPTGASASDLPPGASVGAQTSDAPSTGGNGGTAGVGVGHGTGQQSRGAEFGGIGAPGHSGASASGLGQASHGAAVESAPLSSVFDLIEMGGGSGSGSGATTAGGSPAEPPGRWEIASAGLYAAGSSRPRRRTDFPEVERWGVGLGQLAEGEEDVQSLLGLLRQFATFSHGPPETADLPAFQQRLSTVPLRVKRTLREALTTLASQMTPEKPGEQMMIQLAEHMAIRFALKSFQSGTARVSAVRELLERMGREIDQLRKTLVGHETRMADAGLAYRPYAEQLNEQFWANVSQEKKKEVLQSKEAWCMSPQAVRQAVEARRAEGDVEGAAGILAYYAQNISSDEANARRFTAMGITELADLFAQSEDLLLETIRSTGAQVAREKDVQARSLVSAAFVRLSTEAVSRRRYLAMAAAVRALQTLASQDFDTAEGLHQRIGIQERMPELVEEALSAKECSSGLADLLTLLPRRAVHCLAERFSQSGFREDCNLILGMARKTGAEGVACLREAFRDSKVVGAVETVGLLGRLDPEALARYLPGRVREWPRSLHDRLVRYLAGSGAHERARLILSVLDELDPLVRPMALDEVGLVGDGLCLPRLLELASGGIPAGSGAYLQVKAIEALGRARAPEAVALLRPLVETRKMFHWVHPHELRLAAAQALEKIDPQWAQSFLLRAGFSPEELALGPVDADPNSACNRQRRYV